MTQPTDHRSPPSTPPSARRLGGVLGAAGALLLCSATSTALAQNDILQPQPNVLLLVDTSGSMEYKTGSDEFPLCRYNGVTDTGFNANTDRQTSRWIDLVEVLTGTIQNYQCQKLFRDTTLFDNLYKPGAATPYDFLYTNPYHRPLSGTCAPGPGYVDPVNPGKFSTDNPATVGTDESAIYYRLYNNPSTPCTFNQAPDGILDAFRTGVRFGLMTFDTDVSPNTGEPGLWSYFVGTPELGMPLGCVVPQPQEVGARNALAPPWEGRLVGFGDPSPGSTDYQTRNDQIQQIILATRPYGATPIAGLMEDARAFLWTDTSKDPQNTSIDLGTYNDPYIQAGCRETSIILLSDGAPNLDLRPDCDDSNPNGCPFDKPEDIALDLRNPSNPGRPSVKTYVIGFAISSFTVDGVPTNCKDIDLGSGGPCATNPSDPAIQACCALNRIAAAGGDTPSDRALFAANRDELKSALTTVLTKHFTPTSRTQPVLGPGARLNSDFARAVRIVSGFAPVQFRPWQARLERERWVCERASPTDPVLPVARPISEQDGDDFIANVNSGAGPKRLFIGVDGGANPSSGSLRPNLINNPNDGLGLQDAVAYVDSDKDWADRTTPAQMDITNATCPGLSATDCKRRYLYWLVGLDNGTEYHRCPVRGAGDCALIGDIFHSTPKLVGPPNDLLVDESYRQFAADNAKRPLVLYTSTNDGFLHAFKVSPNDPEDNEKVNSRRNNELWAFVPPAILPHLPSQYPYTHQVLLDGVPVVKDVVATENPSAPVGKYRYVLERTLAQAQAGGGTWRTILVQSFGSERPGYFAMDITDPIAVEGDPTKGPRFLWQITNDESGQPLFGLGGATPLITTVFIDGKEVAVAVLPGGRGSPGGAGSGSGCARQTTSFTGLVDSGFTPRARIPCYSGAAIKARSLTIVRLDTGEIIRTFRQSASEVAVPVERVIVSKLDSPITGQPVAYPADTGSVADRVFVGDQDGTLWKVDLSSSNPADWTMTLFFDGFAPNAFASVPAANVQYSLGQPIATPPILSVDLRGDVTINFSTGDQDAVGASSTLTNFVWSITEAPTFSANGEVTSFSSKVNWYRELTGGERVTGPMVLFNSSLFFSTFKPPTAGANVCSVGTSAVWGMHYLIPPMSGGVPAKNQGGAPVRELNFRLSIPASELLGLQPGEAQDRAAIFGVSLAQKPTCNDTDDSFINEYLNYGAHTSLTDMTPGTFQLVMHTGTAGPSSTGGPVSGVSAPQGGTVNAIAVDLQTPPSSSRIDSWAAIVE